MIRGFHDGNHNKEKEEIRDFRDENYNEEEEEEVIRDNVYIYIYIYVYLYIYIYIYIYMRHSPSKRPPLLPISIFEIKCSNRT